MLPGVVSEGGSIRRALWWAGLVLILVGSVASILAGRDVIPGDRTPATVAQLVGAAIVFVEIARRPARVGRTRKGLMLAVLGVALFSLALGLYVMLTRGG